MTPHKPEGDLAASVAEAAARVIAAARQAGVSVAVAESLTGGAVASTLVGVPGASAVLRGGVVAYTEDVKAACLGVDAQLLGERGAVDPAVAEQMASGVARLMDADVAVSTTGVAGPGPDDRGTPAGTVFLGIATRQRAGEWICDHVALSFTGDRPQVRSATVDAALHLLERHLYANRLDA